MKTHITSKLSIVTLFSLAYLSFDLNSNFGDSFSIKEMQGQQKTAVSEMKNYLKNTIELKEDSGIKTTLFYGPSGTGKATAAKKIAEESGTLFKDVDKITDPRIHSSIHCFLNSYAQNLKYICAILTATNHHKYQDPEKRYMDRFRFDLPTISEKKQFIISQLKKHNRHLSNFKISLIAAKGYYKK